MMKQVTERPEEALELLKRSCEEFGTGVFIVPELAYDMLMYIQHLETLVLKDESLEVREVAEQLIKDGWYSGSLDELVEAARRLCK